ncbi:hypothetical protein BEL07_02940 [Mycolicibacterium grossiae]|uniref:Uncharacterized protein n=1 Tax=Mycolicibacterium grossiae TaxID=1552759 RepID=A0A1E8Q9J0_9MYCO|nr:hypothetical protein BEL07_02940 [Mycolicibacterium grossiae]
MRPGNGADGWRTSSAISGWPSAARNSTARSCGDVTDSQPGPSSPDGDAARVLRAPRAAALRFIAATATRWPPSMSASIVAASLPDTISSADSSCRTVYGVPGVSPTQEHSILVCEAFARAKLSGLRWSRTTIASSTLIVLAGAYAP